MSNKYTTLKDSLIYKDSFGNSFPDIFSFPIESFKYTEITQKYIINSRDIYRFDLLMYNYYGDSSYDDLVLWLNNIELISEMNPGDTLELPSKRDLDNFYRDNFA